MPQLHINPTNPFLTPTVKMCLEADRIVKQYEGFIEKEDLTPRQRYVLSTSIRMCVCVYVG